MPDTEPSLEPARRQPSGYDAFLSYSHAADGRLAPALQKALHRLAKPWYRVRALRVFRDQVSLAANPDLWSTITAALESSRNFVLLASPESAASQWVQRELEYWKENRAPETLLIVLTGGTIAWDDAAGDFDWDRTTALPGQLRGWFRAEPLWVPLEWARTDAHLSLRHAGFRDAVATLAASLHDRPKDDLDSEDVRQHRTFTRVRNAVIGIVLVLALFAAQQAYRAQAALEQAVSRELAGRSETLGDTAPVVSKLLSVAAWRVDPTPEARGAMVAALARPGVDVIHEPGSPALSANGRVLASAHGDGTIQLYDTASREPLGEPLTGTGEYGSLKISPDGRVLAAGDRNGVLQLWDIASREALADPVHAHDAPVFATAFSSDGRVLATAGLDRAVKLWDTASGEQIGAEMYGYETGSIAFSPDGRLLAFFDGQAVRLWDTASGQPVGAPITEFIGVVQGITFSPDGSLLATAGVDGAIRLWDTASQQRIGDPIGGVFRGGLGGEGIRAVAFTSDGSVISAVGVDGTVHRWYAKSRREIGAGLIGGVIVAGAAFSADGGTLVTANADDTMRIWDLDSATPSGIPVGHAESTSRIAEISPDGRAVAIADRDGVVRLWDIATNSQIGGPYTIADGRAIDFLRFSPDGSKLALGSDDEAGEATLWDIRSGARLGSWPHAAQPLEFGPDGESLVTVAERGRTEPALPDGANELASSPDGRVLVVELDDDQVQLWDTTTGASLGVLVPGGSQFRSSQAVFSADGRMLAVGGTDGIVRLYDVATRRQIGDPLTDFSPVEGLAFSPDGNTLAIWEIGAVNLWDVESRRRIGEPLQVYGENPTAVSFGRDGRTLVSSVGSYGDGPPAARIWPMPERVHLDVALCAHTGRSLTLEEWQRYIPGLPYREICP